MLKTRASGPAIACVCTLVLGVGGMATGFMLDASASSTATQAQTQAATAPAATRVAAKDVVIKDVVKSPSTASRASVGLTGRHTAH
jgi:hypothetical protein